MGSMFYYLLGIVIAVGVLIAVKLLSRRFAMVNKIYTAVSKVLFFNLILRFLLEGYLEFAIDALINMTNLHWGTSTEKFSSMFSILLLIMSLFFPIFIVVFLQFFKNRLTNWHHRVGSLYENVNINSRACLLYQFFFVARRLMFAAIVVLMIKQPVLQIVLVFYQCIVMVIYIMYFKPFNTPMLNRVEIFNELCILGCAYPLLMFTDFEPDQDKQYQAGFCMIAVTSLNIAVNTIIMIVMTARKIKLACRKLRYRFAQWRLKKAKERARAKYNGDEKEEDHVRGESLEDNEGAFIEKVRRNLRNYRDPQDLAMDPPEGVFEKVPENANFLGPIGISRAQTNNFMESEKASSPTSLSQVKPRSTIIPAIFAYFKGKTKIASRASSENHLVEDLGSPSPRFQKHESQLKLESIMDMDKSGLEEGQGEDSGDLDREEDSSPDKAKNPMSPRYYQPDQFNQTGSKPPPTVAQRAYTFRMIMENLQQQNQSDRSHISEEQKDEADPKANLDKTY